MNRRVVAGLLAALFIVGLAFASYRFSLAQQEGVAAFDFMSATSGIVALAILSAYMMSALVWKVFLGRFGVVQTWGQAVVDIGLLSVGKYIPGKVVGLISRGAVNDGVFAPSVKGASLSVVEQLVSLAIGCLTGVFLYLVFGLGAGPLGKVALVVAYVVLCGGMLRAVYWVVSLLPFLRQRIPVSRKVSYGESVGLGLSYGLIWGLTGLSIYPLLPNDLDVANKLLLVSAFILSMVAGWLAVIAPAGIGVREGVFTALAGGLIGWKEALVIISVHRIICCIVDVFYGALCFLYMYVGFLHRRQ